MTTQERTERWRIRRRKQVAKQKMVLLLVAIFVITLGSIVFGSIFSSAKNPDADIPKYKYYKSIEIHHGDTLWDIAKEYCSDPGVTTQEYIDEIKELNSLKSETIHAGQHLIITYYDTELK